MINVNDQKTFQIKNLGLIDYDKAYAIQRAKVEAVIAGEKQAIFICEHPSIITGGRMTHQEHLLASADDLRRKGVKHRDIDRGGDITLHAPGQIVVYPILNLLHWGKDLHHYMERLQKVIIDLLSRFDIVAEGIDGQRGVWVKDRKIASIGVGVRKWVSYHGLAININTDLSLFSLIKPCGLDVQMTSIEQISGRKIDMDLVKNLLRKVLLEQFKSDLI